MLNFSPRLRLIRRSLDTSISGWRASLQRDKQMLLLSLPVLKELALGGTAVGTGLNAPKGFDEKVAQAVSQLTGKDLTTAANKFHALTSAARIIFIVILSMPLADERVLHPA